MGWLQIARGLTVAKSPTHTSSWKEVSTQHIEDTGLPCTYNHEGSSPRSKLPKYPYVPPSVQEQHLPFIPAAEVKQKRRPGALVSSSQEVSSLVPDLWIVIDNIVYDCTSFIQEHPGGMQVILSFVGEDCSWQFWRFHGKEQMQGYGRALRIGRTEGVENRFAESTRFVGLRRLGTADDDWD